MIVLDASVIFELLLNTPAAKGIVPYISLPHQTLHAPHLLDVEVAQTLRRYAGEGQIDAERGAEALRDFLDLPITRYAHDLFLPRIWELRHNLTAYDAAYVALAEELDALLLTTDRRMAKAKGHAARIEAI